MALATIKSNSHF